MENTVDKAKLERFQARVEKAKQDLIGHALKAPTEYSDDPRWRALTYYAMSLWIKDRDLRLLEAGKWDEFNQAMYNVMAAKDDATRAEALKRLDALKPFCLGESADVDRARAETTQEGHVKLFSRAKEQGDWK